MPAVILPEEYEQLFARLIVPPPGPLILINGLPGVGKRAVAESLHITLGIDRSFLVEFPDTFPLGFKFTDDPGSSAKSSKPKTEPHPPPTVILRPPPAPHPSWAEARLLPKPPTLVTDRALLDVLAAKAKEIREEVIEASKAYAEIAATKEKGDSKGASSTGRLASSSSRHGNDGKKSAANTEDNNSHNTEKAPHSEEKTEARDKRKGVDRGDLSKDDSGEDVKAKRSADDAKAYWDNVHSQLRIDDNEIYGDGFACPEPSEHEEASKDATLALICKMNELENVSRVAIMSQYIPDTPQGRLTMLALEMAAYFSRRQFICVALTCSDPDEHARRLQSLQRLASRKTVDLSWVAGPKPVSPTAPPASSSEGAGLAGARVDCRDNRVVNIDTAKRQPLDVALQISSYAQERVAAREHEAFQALCERSSIVSNSTAPGSIRIPRHLSTSGTRLGSLRRMMVRRESTADIAATSSTSNPISPTASESSTILSPLSSIFSPITPTTARFGETPDPSPVDDEPVGSGIDWKAINWGKRLDEP